MRKPLIVGFINVNDRHIPGSINHAVLDVDLC